MNRTYKTLWSDVRQSCVVTHEACKSHGKSKKCAVAAVVAAAFFGAAAASGAYVEQGKLGSTSSWESAEYGSANATTEGQHALTRINASTAYAEGYTGKGVVVGVVDSGALLSHSEMNDGRFSGVTATGTYYKTGTRYPFASLGQKGQTLNPTGEYTKGEAFKVGGDWILGHNDSHGTHVTSVAAGSRNGELSHGVAFESTVAVGNTGGTDNMNYGPYQDYNYFYAVWDAVGSTGAKVINNSWGTNIRINDDTSQHFEVGAMPEDKADGSNEPNYGTLVGIGGSEKEYFLFMADAEANGGKNFMDAAYETATKHDLIQIFTNGNRQFQNPYYRAAYAYYNPEAETYWIAAGGVDVDAAGNEKVMGWGQAYTGTGKPASGSAYNRPGFAKWWGIAAPTNVLGAKVSAATGEAASGKAGGTSNAAPHIAGSLGVLFERFGSYMTATQVRDVMFTTARQTQYNNPAERLPGISETEFGAPEDDYGWGIVDLGKAIYGPGQFFGTFDVTMEGIDDQWDNAITEKAIVLRGVEDTAEKGQIETRLAELAVLTTLTDEQRWEKQYKEKRLAAINEREAQGNVGRLIKRGSGTLTLTAVNSYSGGTEIHGGTVAGLTESFGTGPVTVKSGAAVELHAAFDVRHADDTDWVTTHVTGTADNRDDDASIVLEDGSTLRLADTDLHMKSLTVSGTATVSGAFTAEQLASLQNGEVGSLVVNATVDTLQMNEGAALEGEGGYAFFDTNVVTVDNSRIEATVTSNGKTAASFANGANEAAVAAALESAAMTELLTADAATLSATLASIGSDLHLAAQNATAVNAVSVSRLVKDQANAFGTARRAELENGVTLWAAGTGSWMNVDAGGASVDMDVDTYAGFVGGEFEYAPGHKAGAYFGYGQTDFDAGGDGDMESDDIHLGIYGQNTWNAVALTYGLAYTTQDRESDRTLSYLGTMSRNAVSYDADVLQVFGEVSWKGFDTEAYQVEPYVGLSWLRVSADGFTEKAGAQTVRTEIDDQNLGLATVGVRGSVPFTAGSVNMKVRADVGYAQFFGDTESTATVTVGTAVANLTGEELSGMGTVGLGLEAALGANATLGVGYTGAFGSDITSHGIAAKLGIVF